MNEPDEVRGTSPIASRCESTVEVASGRLGHDQDHDLDLERQAQDKYTMHAGRRECRICLQDDADSDLTRPCQCSGSLQYVHVDCLRRWVKESGRRNCEICKSAFVPELIEGVEPEGETAVWQRRPSRSDEPSPTSSRSKWMPIIAAVCILSGLVLVIVLIGT